MFIRNIKEELYRGFHNRGMYMALVLGIFFIICHFLFVIMKYASSYIGVYINIDYPSNVFTTTLMFDMEGVFPIYYAYIFPLFAALPFASSYYDECKNGYRNQVLLRGGMGNYLCSKYIAVFVTAGVVVSIPLLFDLMLSMACLPSLIPQNGLSIYAVAEQDWMGELFYTHPFFYIFLYLFVLFCLAGILASISLAVSAFLSGKYIVLFMPFIVSLILESIFTFIGKEKWSVFNIVFKGRMDISSARIVFLIWPIIAVISFILYYRAGGKKYDKL